LAIRAYCTKAMLLLMTQMASANETEREKTPN
jgi:hypothetical protein